MNVELRKRIAELLVETGKAHHKAFEETDGADPEWPIWYAEYARDKFAEKFGLKFTKSQRQGWDAHVLRRHSLGSCGRRFASESTKKKGPDKGP